MIQILHGTNRVEIQERVQHLRDHNDPTGINTTIIHQASDQPSALRAASCAVGFFGANRLVIAHDLIAPCAARRKRRSEKSNAESPLDQVLAVLTDVPATTLLVIIEETIGSTEERALKRLLQELRVERVDVPRGRDLVAWVIGRADRYDAVIEPAVAEQLFEALFPGTWRAPARRDDLPPNLYRVDSEIAKLATAARPSGRITQENVAALVLGADALNIWGLTNAIAAGDPAAAVREVERELVIGTPAEMIVGQLAAQMETFAALVARNGPPNPAAVAAETGLTEARLQQATRSLRQFSRERVRRALDELRNTDFAIKQGKTDAADALVGLVVQLAAER